MKSKTPSSFSSSLFLLAVFVLSAAGSALRAQSTGDYLFYRKAGAGFDGIYLTPANNQVLGFNGSGALSLSTPFSGAFADLTGKPTTLSGFGITDAQPLDADLTALAALTGTNTMYYRSVANTWTPVTIGTGLTFTSGTLSANPSVGGSSGQVQYNNGGVFGGLSGMTTSGGVLATQSITIDDASHIGFTVQDASGQSATVWRYLRSDGKRMIQMQRSSDTHSGVLSLFTDDAAETQLTGNSGLIISAPASASASFRLLPNGNDIYLQNTVSSGDMYFTGGFGADSSGAFHFRTAGDVKIGPNGSERFDANGTSGSVTVMPANDTTGWTITGGTVTGSGITPFASITGTWNTTGSPVGVAINFTNTASGSHALIEQWNVDSSEKFSVEKTGKMHAAVGFGIGTSSFDFVSFDTNGISAPYGNYTISSGASVIINSSGVIWRTGSGTPEGNITAPVGSLYTRTDGGTSTTLYIKESGSGNTGWIAK
jgi:hypothetical protein